LQLSWPNVTPLDSEFIRVPAFLSDDDLSMRSISGALLLLTAEQAFAHAHSASFPNEPFVRDVLFPASGVLALSGVILLIWGLLTERK
jgi:hypothetical protein